jgi:hypothetical protein
VAAVEPLAHGGNDRTPTEIDFAAAEAEAAAFTGGLESEDDLPAVDADQSETAPGGDPAQTVESAPAAELGSTRVIVSGLASVANIANFKRSLGRLPGISTIAVASGADGDFVFTAGHTLGSALSASVPAMTGFDIHVTGESGDSISVVAQDRDSSD